MKFYKNKAFFTMLSLVPFFNSCMKPFSESALNPGAGFNGSFEHVSNGLPANWLVYTSNTAGEGDFSIGLDSSEFANGKQSLKFEVKNCSPKGGRFSPGISQEIPVNAGETHHISFFVKNTGARFLIKIGSTTAFEGKEGPVLESSAVLDVWKKYSYEYKIPEGMEKLKFEASVLSKGIFWIDEIQVLKVK